jgi:hypothetical protein
MACGTNKISRSGLYSQPTQLSHPKSTPVDQVSRQRAVEAAKQADRQVSQAKQAVQTASSLSAIRSALQTAQRALDDARRAGGDKAARARVRDLEKQIDQLRRQASAKQSEITGSEQQRLTVIRDTLGRDSLGVQVLNVQLPSARRTEEVCREVAPNTADDRFGQVVNHAERAAVAACSVGGKTLEELIEDKKAAQRTLSAALRANAPDALITQLKEAIRTIQRAEAKAQSERVESPDAAQAEVSREPTVIHTESGSKGAWNSLLKSPPPNAAIVVDNRIVYETDSLARTVRARTVLDQVVPKELRKSMQKEFRNRREQTAAGGYDRLAGDHGGHLFGTLFGGPGERININAMASKINQGAYERMEEFWANEIDDNRVVDVSVDIDYPGTSMRPDSFTIIFDTDDGKSHHFRFEQ